MLKAVQNASHDVLNFYKYPSDMPLAGDFDIPVIKGIKLKHPERYQLVAFDECHLIPTEQRKKYIVHFFIYDYKFERVWTFLNKNTEYLRQFAAVIGPDFSQYVDMPRAMCIWNAWRTNFVTWWWQNEGLNVIPNGMWSDTKSFEYCFDAMPHNSCICISSKGCVIEDRRHTRLPQSDLVATSSRFKAGLEALVENIHPTQILWLGTEPEWVNKMCEDNNIEIIRMKHRKLYQERLDKRNKSKTQQGQ